MAKNAVDLRFGVRRSDGCVSSVWRLWATKAGDVYLATRRMAAIEKYSFHKSMICRLAFTKEHGTPSTMADRAAYKWRRAPTTPAGSDRASRVAWLAVPTDYLSRLSEIDDGPSIVWIDAAPPGGATYIELAFTAEARSRIEQSFTQNDRRLLLYQSVGTHEAFIVDYYYADWENTELKVPGNGTGSDLLFSPLDPAGTGRPIRITFGPIPKDGDAAIIQELGGYAVAPRQ